MLVYQLPIMSTGSLRTRLIKAGLWRTVLNRQRHDLGVGIQQEYFKGYYVANISVGTPGWPHIAEKKRNISIFTPAQQLLVGMQTASPNFWLINPNCTGKSCLTRPAVAKHQRVHFNLKSNK
jgi:hypothetical protein